MNNKKGFTLVECIAAIAIIAIVTIMFITVFGTSLKITQASIKNNHNSIEAMNKIIESPSATTSGEMTLTFDGSDYTKSINNYDGINDGLTYRAFEVNP